ncbi:MAG: DUF948 domain-containing protein [Victivallaceae bacterium]
MQAALQIASIIALIVFIILVLCLIPTVFYVRRKLAELLQTTQKLEDELQTVAQNVNAFTQRVNAQIDDASKVVTTVVQWSDMANRMVTGIGSIIEPPVSMMARNISLFRLGMSVFMQALRSKKTTNQKQVEEDHV